jgi:hypothetical protein
MTAYKDPTFQRRAGQAAQARKAALEQLQSRPPRDEAIIAQRIEVERRRDADRDDRSAAKRVSEEAAKASRTAAKPVVPEGTTDADRKAARDARYAARKGRK